jgi:hypothetical protein
MADNIGYTPGSGALVASDEVTYSGDTSLVQLMRPVVVSGSEGSKTVVDLPGDNTNGLDVDVTRVSGNVTVVQATAANLNATVEGTVTANAGTGSFTVVQSTAANLKTDANITNAVVTIGNGSDAISVDTSSTDAESNAVNTLHTQARHFQWNGSTWDRVRAHATVNDCATFTSAQTGTALWTPASNFSVVITALQIQSYGTTAGTCVVWFGASGDTTYNRGTDFALFDGEFAPSNTNKPGVFVTFPTPVRGSQNYVLRLTTTNAQSVTVSVWGYEI